MSIEYDIYIYGKHFYLQIVWMIMCFFLLSLIQFKNKIHYDLWLGENRGGSIQHENLPLATINILYTLGDSLSLRMFTILWFIYLANMFSTNITPCHINT